MPANLQPILFLTGVVGFWLLLFVTTIVLTRWALHGVGEITPDELSDLGVAGGDGTSPNGAKATTGSSAAAAGGH